MALYRCIGMIRVMEVEYVVIILKKKLKRKEIKVQKMGKNCSLVIFGSN